MRYDLWRKWLVKQDKVNLFTIEPYFNIVLNKTISKYLAPGSDTNDIFFKKFVQYI
jgi:hypothetical protein